MARRYRTGFNRSSSFSGYFLRSMQRNRGFESGPDVFEIALGGFDACLDRLGGFGSTDSDESAGMETSIWAGMLLRVLVGGGV